MIRKGLFSLAIFLFGCIIFANSTISEASSNPTYTITPNSKTFNGSFTNYSTYNKQTKHYYLIRSYFEQLEKTKGGTIVLKKGTYTVSNVLYVPSNVTIKLENGAKIVKGANSGTSQFKASKSLFQFVSPSKQSKNGVYGGYKGEKNISIIGSGKATIDLNNIYDSIAIIAGHNQNIKIENIEFINMNSGHFIEIDATKNAVIKNNKFMFSKASPNQNKEAINIDTPDKATLGWSSTWSNFDKTPNSNMLIENNYFYDLDRAIGTHKYSGGKLHNEIIIRNNKIEKMRQDPIRVMNWSNSIIEHNHIKDVNPGTGNNRRGILASGAINPTFQHNIFENVPRPMQFMAWKNNGAGSKYDIIYNELSDTNIAALNTNVGINNTEYFIRINHVYDRFDREVTDFVDIKEGLFSDLLEGNDGYQETIELVEQGIINGYGDNTFKPYQSISRQHVAVLLERALPLERPTNVSSNLANYRDVDVNHTYAQEIATVTKAGIFGGGNGKFNPTNNINRGQMASVLVRAFDLKDTGEEIELIDLEQIDASHRENVKILAQNNITTGKVNSNGERYFDAEGKLTRLQFTLLLHRALNIVE